jgi:hypothetical protein
MLSEVKKPQSWNAKNSLVIQEIASGKGTTETAKALGYSVTHTSRILHSPRGQVELKRLLEESEEILAKSLPLLTSLAVDELKRLLSSHLYEQRARGLELALRYLVAPTLKSSIKARDSPGLIEICSMNHEETPNALDANYLNKDIDHDN